MPKFYSKYILIDCLKFIIFRTKLMPNNIEKLSKSAYSWTNQIYKNNEQIN